MSAPFLIHITADHIRPILIHEVTRRITKASSLEPAGQDITDPAERTESMTAGAIAEQFQRGGRSQRGMTRPAVSKHLRLLRSSRLVTVKKQGRERVYQLNAEPLREVEAWVKQHQQFWDQQLQSFKDYVEKEKDNDQKS